MLFAFFHFFWLSSSSSLNLYGLTSIRKLSTYESPFVDNMFNNFNIVVFKVSLLTFVLYKTIEYWASTVASIVPELSLILPLSAFSTLSLVSFVFEVSLYSSPCTIWRLNNWASSTIPTIYTNIVNILYLILSFLAFSFPN